MSVCHRRTVHDSSSDTAYVISGCQNVGFVWNTSRKGQLMRTCIDLIDNLLRRLFVEIVHYDIRAAGTVKQ